MNERTEREIKNFMRTGFWVFAVLFFVIALFFGAARRQAAQDRHTIQILQQEGYQPDEIRQILGIDKK